MANLQIQTMKQDLAGAPPTQVTTTEPTSKAPSEPQLPQSKGGVLPGMASPSGTIKPAAGLSGGAPSGGGLPSVNLPPVGTSPTPKPIVPSTPSSPSTSIPSTAPALKPSSTIKPDSGPTVVPSTPPTPSVPGAAKTIAKLPEDLPEPEGQPQKTKLGGLSLNANRPLMLTAAAVLLVTVVGGGYYYFFVMKSTTPKEIVPPAAITPAVTSPTAVPTNPDTVAPSAVAPPSAPKNIVTADKKIALAKGTLKNQLQSAGNGLIEVTNNTTDKTTLLVLQELNLQLPQISTILGNQAWVYINGNKASILLLAETGMSNKAVVNALKSAEGNLIEQGKNLFLDSQTKDSLVVAPGSSFKQSTKNSEVRYFNYQPEGAGSIDWVVVPVNGENIIFISSSEQSTNQILQKLK